MPKKLADRILLGVFLYFGIVLITGFILFRMGFTLLGLILAGAADVGAVLGVVGFVAIVLLEER